MPNFFGIFVCMVFGNVDKKIRINAGTNVNIQENVVATVPSSGRSPTANKRFNSIAAVESENSEPKKTGVSNLWINKNQTFADKNVYNSGTGNLDSTFLRTEYQSAETDAWEKAEMAKITERYFDLKCALVFYIFPL